jgi:ethanolamine ammonia-lyase small subunit
VSGPVAEDPWDRLRALTDARIALGRAGAGMPTRRHLEFQLAHARATKAVHDELDAEALAEGLAGLGLDVVGVASAAPDRRAYLQRPDLGRRLSPESRAALEARAGEGCDVALVVGDGLSARAVETNARAVLAALLPGLREAGLALGPCVVARGARVALGDEVGEVLGARLVLMAIGERPGLSAPDGMGLYLTWAPRVGTTDEARNCISNIRPAGQSPEAAARTALWLVREALRRRLTGVALKDDAPVSAIAGRRAATFLTAPD